MLTRTWIAQVQPEWKVTLAGSAAQRADEPSLADAPDDGARRRVRRGHREAFDVIVERHQRPIYNLCYRFVRSHEDASDLTQDVFIRAYRSLATVQAAVVARHLAVSNRRQRLPQQAERARGAQGVAGAARSTMGSR